MKKYTLTIMLLASLSAFALPRETKKTEKSTPTITATVAESNAAVSLQNLQQENLKLRNQVLALLDENEELKGLASFQNTMANMFTMLNQQKQNDQMQDLQAYLDYSRMMSNMLLKLQMISTSK